jgi:hypothetical protein
LFESVCRYYLKRFPLCKVILIGEYTTFFEKLSFLLQEFQPLVITGKTPMAHRAGMIDLFNRENNYSAEQVQDVLKDPSLLKNRVLIIQLKIAACSSEFDCKKHGLFQRVELCSISHSFSLSQQCPGRIVRADTRVLSKDEWAEATKPYHYRYLLPTFRFVFGRGVLKDSLADPVIREKFEALKKQYQALLQHKDPPEKRKQYEQNKSKFNQFVFEQWKTSMFENEPKEQKILMSLFSKGRVAKSAHSEQASHGVEFIHDYSEEIELIKSGSHFLHTSTINREETLSKKEDEQKVNALVEQLKRILI